MEANDTLNFVPQGYKVRPKGSAKSATRDPKG